MAKHYKNTFGLLKKLNELYELATSGGSSYVLPVASGTTLGGIKGGTQLEVDKEGNVKLYPHYPIASTKDKGVAQAGVGVSVRDGVFDIGMDTTHTVSILFPNTWELDTEYDFGNGLYGKKTAANEWSLYTK